MVCRKGQNKMNDEISVWASYDRYSGTYSLQLDAPKNPIRISCMTEVRMTRRQYDELKDILRRQYNAKQFVMRAMGLKNQWSGGIETEPEVDDELLPK